ncbi:MAG: pyridoxamine 5'-phosphate oxidase family protein [Candidatus Omnitrophica bacterium]|nr:pyridoxamine 5'-phosphate oxidase family protein [Candidatus Omnitrophota bacterium]
MEINAKIERFLKDHTIAIISTVNQQGEIHSSVKEIVGFENTGKLFIMDLYQNKTLANLKKNPTITLTMVDEVKFKGYAFIGKAKIVIKKNIKQDLIHGWENRIIKRISKRLIEKVKSENAARVNFEAHLPHQPKHLIEVDIDRIIDLAPPKIKNNKR